MRKILSKAPVFAIAAVLICGTSVYAMEDTGAEPYERGGGNEAPRECNMEGGGQYGPGGEMGGPHQRKGQQGKGGEKIAEMLGLTEEQEEAIREHRQKHMEEMREMSQGLKDKRFQLYQELEKQDADEAKITSLAADVKSLLSRQVDLRVSRILAMKSLLTPEQFAKLQESIKNNVKRHKGQNRGHQHRQGGQRGPDGYEGGPPR